MADVDFNDLGKFGVVRDAPPYMLPPEAWSIANNVRATDEGMKPLGGWESIFGTPGADVHFALYVSGPSQPWWLWASLIKAYVWDGTNHTEITRAAGGNYGATAGRQWNGLVFQGIPILNNGVDVPQYWASYAAATDLAALPNWPAAWRAKILRAFGPFLVAFRTIESGTEFPHRVSWSHPADPGAVPTSWDVTDPEVDAGNVELTDNAPGMIVEARMLGDMMMVYKEESVHRMRFVGGRSIFGFQTYLEEIGILAERCVVPFKRGTQHCFATKGDLLVHDGMSQPISVLDRRLKTVMENKVDEVFYRNSFMFHHHPKNELWFCYPEQGSSGVPSRAIIWNYDRGALTEADVPFVYAATGDVQTASGETWDSDSEAWDDDIGPWDSQKRNKVVAVNGTGQKFFELESGNQRDGEAFVATLQREGLSVIGRKRTGEWITDIQFRKFVNNLRPKLTEGKIFIRVGYQERIKGAIAWGPKIEFDSETDIILHPTDGSGMLFGVEFSWENGNAGELSGFKMQVDAIGEF